MASTKIRAKLIPETPCRCGGRFFVATWKGAPKIFHTEPVCRVANNYSGADFLKWVRTGEEPPAPPAPNRKQRRQMAALKRLRGAR